MSFGEFYAFAFFKVRGWALALADDGFHDWKALTALGVVQVYLACGAVSFVEGSTGASLLPARPWVMAFPLGISIFAVNYLALLHRERWRLYEHVFRQYSAWKHRVLAALVIVTFAASIYFGFVMAAYGV